MRRQRTVAEYGTVDILVNNAQVPPLGPIAEISEELFDTGWKTGPLATFRFMRACYPYLKGGGVVVNMGSGSAIRPTSLRSAGTARARRPSAR